MNHQQRKFIKVNYMLYTKVENCTNQGKLLNKLVLVLVRTECI